jgi:hypothetical protein
MVSFVERKSIVMKASSIFSILLCLKAFSTNGISLTLAICNPSFSTEKNWFKWIVLLQVKNNLIKSWIGYFFSIETNGFSQ